MTKSNIRNIRSSKKRLAQVNANRARLQELARYCAIGAVRTEVARKEIEELTGYHIAGTRFQIARELSNLIEAAERESK